MIPKCNLVYLPQIIRNWARGDENVSQKEIQIAREIIYNRLHYFQKVKMHLIFSFSNVQIWLE